MQIYLFDDFDSITDGILDRLIASLPEARRQKALRYRRRSDRLTCAAAYHLLRYALAQSRGILGFAVAEERNGKPYLADHPEVHFNLSHCACGCICALSEREVGADIQDIARANEKVLRLVCSEKEISAITVSDEPDRQFTRIWAMKEAYLKMLGTGIASDPKAADTALLGNVTVLDCGGYFIAAATEPPEEVTVIRTELACLTENIL